MTEQEMAGGGAVSLSIEDGADRALIEVTGEDRTGFLQGMLTNDVAALTDGTSCAALLLTDQGRVVADLRVLAAEEVLLLDVPATRAKEVPAALDRYIVADDVELEPLGHASVVVRGAAAAALIADVVPPGTIPGDLGDGAHVAFSFDGSELRLVRADDAAGVALRVWGAPEAVATFARAIEAKGARRLSESEAEWGRLQAGRANDADYDLDTLAPELPSFADAISYRKGCYLGQEVVERVAARGKVNWLVVPLELDGPEPVAAGLEVRADGSAVGAVTSAASDGRSSARVMARIRRAASDVGTALEIETPAGPRGATVAPRPE